MGEGCDPFDILKDHSRVKNPLWRDKNSPREASQEATVVAQERTNGNL